MTAYVIVTGFVQGIGFRQFVKSNADRLGLTGWVRNLPDGSVEALFTGSKETIEQMIALCKKGPFLAEVEEVHVKWKKEEKKFEDFVIV